jgi:hypothetical protein
MQPQPYQQQQNQQSTLKLNQPHASETPDLAQVLRGEKGTFEAIYNGQSFIVQCDPQGNVFSLVPNGHKNVWIITRRETLSQVEFDEIQRSRAANA